MGDLQNLSLNQDIIIQLQGNAAINLFHNKAENKG